MTKKVTLSTRMKALADMVTEGNRVCDLGCDHGYLPLYLVSHNISPCALAMDVREGPLMRARENVREAGLTKYITLRLSDGLAGYETGEADTLICAGMGGPLMRRILEEEAAKTKSFRELILQPQSDITTFRGFLRKSGWIICQENMIYEDGKFYPMMKVYLTDGKPDDMLPEIPVELADRFGPLLLKGKHPVLWEFLQREWEKCGELKCVLEKASDSERAKKKLAVHIEEMTYLKEAAKLYGKDYD